MKPNKLTHGHNLMWESSRMMLPEHKELLQQHQQRVIRKNKPHLDDQEIEWLEYQINHAMNNRNLVEITLFDSYYNHAVVGMIKSIDLQTNRIKLQQSDGEMEWINFNDILQIEIK